MPPTIHFIRHAQGYHNISAANHVMHDPLLTPHGEVQCRTLAASFPYIHSTDLLVASPLKRTIYTALLTLPTRTDLTLIALPEVQETSDAPCDTGSSREEITKEFEKMGRKLDLSLVTQDWNSKKGKWGPSKEKVEERCRVARNWLRDRKEKEIVVVTHGGVLHYLTEDWSDMNHELGTGWANTEYRSYTFKADTGNAASLVETEDSRTRRRGLEKPLTEAEERNIKHTEKMEEKHDASAANGTHADAKPPIGAHTNGMSVAAKV